MMGAWVLCPDPPGPAHLHLNKMRHLGKESEHLLGEKGKRARPLCKQP